MDTSNHPLNEVVEVLRSILLSIDPEIEEQRKWNSPAFYFTGEMKPFDPKEYKRDLVVFNLHKQDQVLLIFPTGGNLKKTIKLLEGKYPDSRKSLLFKSINDVNQKKEALILVVKEWLELIEK